MVEAADGMTDYPGPLHDGAAPTERIVMSDCCKFGMRASASDLEYEIFVYVPDVPPPPTGFPVLYVLDANADFVTVAETVRRISRRPLATGIGASIVVGIGYPNTTSYDIDRRYYDFTRGPPVKMPAAEPITARCGGQSAYVGFLAEQLLPYISTHFNAHPHCRTLLGHSLAGYFVLEVMARYPDLFDGYVSFSPSIWWNPQELTGALENSRDVGRSRRLYIAAGRWEQELAPWQKPEDFSNQYHEVRLARRMIDNAREFATQADLCFGADLQVKFEVGDEEDHSTIVTTMLCRALRFVGAAS
jgi:predicted alpha/beta superfamily hydrolase